MAIAHCARFNRSNYLTRLARDQEIPTSDWRKCAVVFNILYPSKGMRQVNHAQLRALCISEAGLCGTTRRGGLPDHFYLSIGDEQLRVACAVVKRKGPMVHLCFLQELPTSFVDVVASLQDPFVFLERIRPSLYGLEGYAD